MQYWPFALGILLAGCGSLGAIILFIKLQKPDTTSRSPHHRWNERSDLRGRTGPSD